MKRATGIMPLNSLHLDKTSFLCLESCPETKRKEYTVWDRILRLFGVIYYLTDHSNTAFMYFFPTPPPLPCVPPTLDCRVIRRGTILLFLVSSAMPNMVPVCNDHLLSVCLIDIMRLKEFVSSRYMNSLQ